MQTSVLNNIRSTRTISFGNALKLFGQRQYSAPASEATIEIKTPYKMHKLDGSPNLNPKLTRDDGLKYYRQMRTIRQMEAAASFLYKDKSILGFCHLYTGQEACCVGVTAAIRQEDPVITSYRAHAWVHSKGVPLGGIMSELVGRTTGCAQGKGGSMHMYGPNFFGGNGIVAAQLPLGTGLAFAAKYKGTDNLSVTLYGDGAANQGQVFESFNIAKLWDLPALFVCENNGFGMGTSTVRAASNIDYYTRGDYIPGIWVDGMNVVAVREATLFAAEYIRAGNGPLVMELGTYRYTGHSLADPGTSYRTREQIQEVRQKRDPLTHFKDDVLLAYNLATADELKAIDTDVKHLVDEAVIKAKTEPEPTIDETYTYVHSQILPGFKIRGCDPSIVISPTK